MTKIILTTKTAGLVGFCLLLCTACTRLYAEPGNTGTAPLPNSPKVIIRLMSGSVIKGTVLNITDSSITIDKPASADATNPQLYNGLVLQTTKNYIVRVQDIKSIKLKRNAFISGLAIGGLIGYGAGYITGYVLHKNNDALSYDENNENAKTLARGVAIAGAAGVGLVGGAIAPIFARRKFTINGNRDAMQKFIKALQRTP